MNAKMTSDEAMAIVTAAREATPTWHWESVEGVHAAAMAETRLAV